MQDIVGFLGAVICSISFLPQLWKIWRTKSAHDLSMVTLIMLFTNASLWTTYGILIDAKPLWITNTIVVAVVFTMVILKILYRKNSPPLS